MNSVVQPTDPEAQRLLERYMLALDVAGNGVWEYPAIEPLQAFEADVPVVYSPGFYEMLGYTAEEFPQVARSWWQVIHPDDLDKSAQSISDHLSGKTQRMFVEYRVLTRRNEVRWWQIYGGSRPDAQPGRIRAIGVVRDITELRRAEQLIREQIDTISRQQLELRELSTPIIQLWDQILTLPLIGSLDADRAHQSLERLLAEVVRVRARFAIIDLTGVDALDTTTADHLHRIVRAVHLIGARALVSGLNPGIAATMSALGVDVSPFVAYRNLQDALQACLREPAFRQRARP